MHIQEAKKVLERANLLISFCEGRNPGWLIGSVLICCYKQKDRWPAGVCAGTIVSFNVSQDQECTIVLVRFTGCGPAPGFFSELEIRMRDKVPEDETKKVKLLVDEVYGGSFDVETYQVFDSPRLGGG